MHNIFKLFKLLSFDISEKIMPDNFGKMLIELKSDFK